MSAFDLTEGPRSLAEDINKMHDESDKSGATLLSIPELTLDMKDEEILALTRKWTSAYTSYESEVKRRQDENERYYLGKQFTIAEMSGDERPMVDNLIFESVETFLPEATRKNPEPTVDADGTPEGQFLTDGYREMLVDLADTLKLKLKIKSLTRHWTLYFLGCLKVSWSQRKNSIDTSAIRPQKLILDPDATITEGGEYTGDYIGERKEETASRMAEKFPSQKEFFSSLVDGKMGTKIHYVEWWTPDKLFYTCREKVLEKFKNPHWNYEETKQTMDEFGMVTEEVVPGINQFISPEMPYVFLSIFNIGRHPHDDTGLIHQNLANQDVINKKQRQILKNTDNQNNSIALSGDHFTKEQAKNAADALSQGDALWVPTGDIRGSYARDSVPNLPADVFNQLADMRNELRNIFGVRGSSAEGIASEQTVRGKIIIGDKDSSRIGGGITEFIEQVADRVFNWWIQMMYVYYDQEHYAETLGQERAAQLLQARQMSTARLKVSVKEGSLIPKDPLVQRNEAIDLWSAGALDPEELFKRLEFPDPKKAAEQLFLWKTMPNALFPDLAAPVALPSAEQQPPQAGAGTDLGAPPPAQDLLSSVPIQ